MISGKLYDIEETDKFLIKVAGLEKKSLNKEPYMKIIVDKRFRMSYDIIIDTIVLRLVEYIRTPTREVYEKIIRKVSIESMNIAICYNAKNGLEVIKRGGLNDPLAYDHEESPSYHRSIKELILRLLNAYCYGNLHDLGRDKKHLTCIIKRFMMVKEHMKTKIKVKKVPKEKLVEETIIMIKGICENIKYKISLIE